ncbi:MAG TPA: hypothetical protein VFM29_01760 [Vicinamibacteria bacterium]|nr:hypothetical protein [Vicinamibacteria bacterium]
MLRIPSIARPVGALVLVALAGTWAEAARPVERFTAFAVDMSLFRDTRTGTVDIAIERWSSAVEQAKLTSALREGGPEALLDALRDSERVGYIRSNSGLGYPLRFAQVTALPGGDRRILIATDRPISFQEATWGGRSRDYPFLIVELKVRANGKGDGRLLPVARVEAGYDDALEVENYLDRPVRLTSVRASR